MKPLETDKIIFIIQPHSIVDVITNSSSELFVFNGNSEEIIKGMISHIYPDYLSEYDEIKNITELTVDELDTYFQYACSSYHWPSRKCDYPVLNGFTFDELYEPEKDWQTGEIKPAWNGEIQYTLRRQKDSYNFVTEENKEELINKLCPDGNMYFLFSKDENPNWDYQEKLMRIGKRFHLG